MIENELQGMTKLNLFPTETSQERKPLSDAALRMRRYRARQKEAMQLDIQQAYRERANEASRRYRANPDNWEHLRKTGRVRQRRYRARKKAMEEELLFQTMSFD